jgi:hypothetical protein
LAPEEMAIALLKAVLWKKRAGISTENKGGDP